jgi:integrase
MTNRSKCRHPVTGKPSAAAWCYSSRRDHARTRPVRWVGIATALIIALLAAAPLVTVAQPAGRVYRVAVVWAVPVSVVGPYRDALVDPFNVMELRAILAAAHEQDPDFATMLRLWMQGGMRAGEVCGLQEQDIDVALGTARVQWTWSHHRVGPPKTHESRRTVCFLHPTADPTPEWQPGATAESRSVLLGLRQRKVQSLEPESFLFGRKGAPLSSMELNRAWRRALTAARVRYRPPEQLRHTWASTMLSRNAPLLYVQQQGGWRSAAVLLRTYSKWMPQDFSPPGALPTATPAQPTATWRRAEEGASAS